MVNAHHNQLTKGITSIYPGTAVTPSLIYSRASLLLTIYAAARHQLVPVFQPNQLVNP